MAAVDATEPYKLGNGNVQMGTQISQDLKEQIQSVLINNQDRFVWEGEAPTQVDRRIASHKLNVDPSFPAQRQKRRALTVDRREAAAAEVEKLLKAGHIREVQYPQWLANPVLVKKANGKWRMCVDIL